MQNRFLLLIFVVCLSGGCAQNSPHTNAALDLSQNDVQLLSKRAVEGEGDAAFRLSEYYYFCEYDPSKAYQWLCLAATNGNEAGEYNLAILYRSGNSVVSNDLSCAKFWFEKLAAKGNKEAIIQLQQLK